MDKNKAKYAFSDVEKAIVYFYREMKWILSSDRGKNFQFMMLGRTFESVLDEVSRIRRRYIGKEIIKSPLDD